MNAFLAITFNSENLLLLGSVLIIMAVIANKLGSRFGVPFLLLALLVGILAGPDGLGLQFDHYERAKGIGHFAMTIILFTAGLETPFTKIKTVLWQGITLSTLGVLLTIALTGVFTYYCLGGTVGESFVMSLLVATIMSSTDSASVFSLLRNKKLQLKENLDGMLELESGSNDPLASTLTSLLVILLVNSQLLGESPGSAVTAALAMVAALQILVGVAVGFLVGALAVPVLRRMKLPGGALTSILVLSFGLFSSGLAEFFAGNGLLAIYITAIMIGQMKDMPYKREVQDFFDGITWLVQLIVFLMLGLLAHPSEMVSEIGPAVLLGLFMILVARPAGVFLSLLPFKRPSYKARLFTSWVGLKGAGPILFALYPVVADLPGATQIFNIVFIITVMSLLLQGLTLVPIARWLGLSIIEDTKAETFGMDIPEEMGVMRDHIVAEEDLMNGSTLRELHLPHGIRVMMVRRDGRFLVPHGSMVLKPGDHLMIILGESDDD